MILPMFVDIFQFCLQTRLSRDMLSTRNNGAKMTSKGDPLCVWRVAFAVFFLNLYRLLLATGQCTVRASLTSLSKTTITRSGKRWQPTGSREAVFIPTLFWSRSCLSHSVHHGQDLHQGVHSLTFCSSIWVFPIA